MTRTEPYWWASLFRPCQHFVLFFFSILTFFFSFFKAYSCQYLQRWFGSHCHFLCLHVHADELADSRMSCWCFLNAAHIQNNHGSCVALSLGLLKQLISSIYQNTRLTQPSMIRLLWDSCTSSKSYWHSLQYHGTCKAEVSIAIFICFRLLVLSVQDLHLECGFKINFIIFISKEQLNSLKLLLVSQVKPTSWWMQLVNRTIIEQNVFF